MRLTLLFDPGRVKTGLVAHNRLGRALVANQKCELVIDSTLQSVDGVPVKATYRKAFRVAEADFEAPDIQRWQLSAPKIDSKEELSIILNDSYDHVSLAYRVRVKDDENQTIPGRIELADAERVWKFIPKRAWKSSTYTIVVDPLLEDIAGNRMTGLFEKPFVEDKSLWSTPKTIAFHPVESNNDKRQIPNRN